MVDAMSKALDELMGKHRNLGGPEADKLKLRYEDPEVCKHELAGLCPYTLFNNTRSDLGECGCDVHTGHREFERLKKEYDELPERKKEELGYQAGLHELLSSLVQKMDQTIARNKEQCVRDNQPRPIRRADQERLDGLKKQEQEQTELSEKLALEGDADGSVAADEAATKAKEQYEALHEELTTPERIKAVCEVCGVFTYSTDTEQRKEEHLNGKQFVGWNKIRSKLKELEEAMGSAQRTSSRTADWHRSSSRERERERDRERDHRHADDYSRDRDRYNQRDRGSGGYGDRRGGNSYGSRHGDRYGDDRRGGGGYGREQERDRYGDRHADRYGGGRERGYGRDYRR